MNSSPPNNTSKPAAINGTANTSRRTNSTSANASAVKATSFFEFWPTWVMYLPVAVEWLLLAVRYRSLTLPLIANPIIPLSGMVGGSKHELMNYAQGHCKAAILPWVYWEVRNEPSAEQAKACVLRAAKKGIHLPFVCKPDIGCRGSGVKLIKSLTELEAVMAVYPFGAGLLCQKLASYEPEVGVFYVKEPDSPQGYIASLTFKDTPSVIGDGEKTLAQLVAEDERAYNLLELYRERNQSHWNQVVIKGERFRLLFSASHCRGAVFTDAKAYITPALTQSLNIIMNDLPDFYYGRLDVKYSNIERLQQGLDLEIVEINGASSESIHIWDKTTRLRDAVKVLLWQYRTLFKLGAYQRKQGVKTPGLLALISAWRKERALTRHYPVTD